MATNLNNQLDFDARDTDGARDTDMDMDGFQFPILLAAMGGAGLFK